MKILLKKDDIYIPEWNGNRELPESEQIKVHFRYLTVADKENIYFDNSGTVASVAKKVFLNNVDRIENFIIEVDGKEIEATPQNILDAPDLFDFFTDVANYIFSASSLSDEQKKS